jgi:hypothetical protein
MTLMLTTRLKESLLERSEKREPFSKGEGGDNMFDEPDFSHIVYYILNRRIV